ncbi:MAG: hypothetical protein JWM36_2113 [Hyphomicrobiales bacterium]|nr:hypothetical protein [Hyphomicrobiales bacterium]
MTMHSIPSAQTSMPLDWLVTPALAFSHPSEVLTNPDLTDPERRVILASWASDAHAIENMPWLRRLEDGPTVPLADVLAALRALDRGMVDGPKPTLTRRVGRMAGLLHRRSRPNVSLEAAP